MSNFLRVVRLTLARRYTFAAAVLCSLGVAVLWGANLGLIKPIVEIVFSEKTAARICRRQGPGRPGQGGRVAEGSRCEQAGHRRWQGDAKQLDPQRQALDNGSIAAQKELEAAQFLQPLVKRFLPNNTFATLALFIGFLVVATLVKDAMLVATWCWSSG